MKGHSMNTYTFNGQFQIIKGHHIIRLPEDISQSLPTRGMVLAELQIHDRQLTIELEPDGQGGHWFELSLETLNDLGPAVDMSKTVPFKIDLEKAWSSPALDHDIRQAFVHHHVLNIWHSLTPKAQWQWVRWIRFTKNSETRLKRIMTACSMLSSGKKRPCCFDQTRCTITDVSKSGVLMTKNDQ
tara:strand:- start:418 stop:972 length:555 start_codon:yes stop_codon:yes gene_type:complete